MKWMSGSGTKRARVAEGPEPPANCSDAAGAGLQAAGSLSQHRRTGHTMRYYHFSICYHYQYCISTWRAHSGSRVSTRKDTEVSKGVQVAVYYIKGT